MRSLFIFIDVCNTKRMSGPTLNQIEVLMRNVVIPFYGIERDMHIPDSTRRHESDAEHSWSLAFMACSLAPQIDPKLNIGLVAQFAIVHDLPEIYATDVSVWDAPDKIKNKDKKEQAACKRLAQEYSYLPWIEETIESYEQRDTREAQFVYALDKLLPLLIRKIDNGRAYVEMKVTKEKFLRKLAPSRQKAQSHPQVGQYFDELWAIFEATPDYFYRPDTKS